MPLTPILTQRSLMLAKLESTFNVDSLPTPILDAFLVSDCQVAIEPNVLERDFYRISLSPLPIGIGRKLARLTFRHEMRGSGKVGVVPALGKLLRGCGFAQTTIANTAAAVIQTPVPHPQNAGPAVTWAKSVAPTQNYGRYGVRVVLGGASAAAKVRVTGSPASGPDPSIFPNEEFSASTMVGTGNLAVSVVSTNPVIPVYTLTGTPVDGDIVLLVIGGVRVRYLVVGTMTLAAVATAVAAAATTALGTRGTAAAVTGMITVTTTGGILTVTTAVTPILLGQSAAELTMSWTGSLVLNDTWKIDLWEPGYQYLPVSDGFQSLTLYVYYDGMLHKYTGAMGSVVFQNDAGNHGFATFNFLGQYIDPIDRPMPKDAVVEDTVPQQVELARLKLGNALDIVAQMFSVDMGITITPRDSVSHSDGYKAVQYTSRAPTGGLNPEMALESEEPHWRNLARATLLSFHGRVGTGANNACHWHSNSVQLSDIRYADRNGNRVYDMSMRFSQEKGDDEIRIAFPNIEV